MFQPAHGCSPNGEAAGTPAAQSYIAFIAALGLVGAAVAHGLARGPRGTFVVLARVGGIALLVGVAAGTARWLADGNLQADGTGGIVITLYFLLGGLLFSTLGWTARSS